MRATMGAKGRTMKRSSLESISGVGRERAKRLLSYFGTIGKIKEASVEELCAVRGMTRPSALAVYSHYHPKETSED